MISEWATKLGITVQRVPNATYRVKDVFTTRDGSWDVSDKVGSVPSWARDAYLKPYGDPLWNDDGGADHHIFGAVWEGGRLRSTGAFNFWTYADNANHTTQQVKKHGWANNVMYASSSYVPERGERGPWAWAPALPADIVKGAGMPAKQHISFWAVWEKAAEQAPVLVDQLGVVTADIGLNLRAYDTTSSSVLITMPPAAVVTVHQKKGDWYEVTYADRRGWAFADYISIATERDARFDRALAFVLKWEGGYSNDAADPGNWTGGAVDVGQLKGTKNGISAAAYPDLDIPNLSSAQVADIYYRDYWLKSGADKLPGALALIHFDTSVNMGVSRAKTLLTESPLSYMGKRLHLYTTLQGWALYGAGWARRVADLMNDAGNW